MHAYAIRVHVEFATSIFSTNPGTTTESKREPNMLMDSAEKRTRNATYCTSQPERNYSHCLVVQYSLYSAPFSCCMQTSLLRHAECGCNDRMISGAKSVAYQRAHNITDVNSAVGLCRYGTHIRLIYHVEPMISHIRIIISGV